MLALITFIVGFISGMYVVTQIEKGIDRNITKENNEFIYNILDEFEKITNIPVLVNTSFNSRGKSILTRYLTAIQILDSTELDAVVLEDYYIYK